MDDNRLSHAESWATAMSGPAYAIDDETAPTVVAGAVEVVSEGHSRLFAASAACRAALQRSRRRWAVC